MITYLKGDATYPQSLQDLQIIIHITNNFGYWKSGFVCALSKRWSQPEAKYREKRQTLGDVQFIPVEPNIIVANLCAQKGIHWENGKPPIRYEALQECFGKVMGFIKTYAVPTISIHGSKLGSCRAGGDWKIIEQMLEDTFVTQGVPVFIYEWNGPK